MRRGVRRVRRGDIQKAIASINELGCENKSAGPNSTDATGNLKILERRLSVRLSLYTNDTKGICSNTCFTFKPETSFPSRSQPSTSQSPTTTPATTRRTSRTPSTSPSPTTTSGASGRTSGIVSTPFDVSPDES